ncbi:biopolymer transport protein ExbB [Methylomarinovum caldicuralii]|uniref:Biopolymer transport protein ExbB n=1 Tax=Methylomarinovum caldicuralii TaxID=438856 RepID=A0AAU9BV14_9GAMM|nr:MotA/TolQ/ExbB proton channel family protein [Methylomarinovum caldicuralii]BCX82556.1 biopolymer transport protein ExbB [Methylomarinovum caldicuralii]
MNIKILLFAFLSAFTSLAAAAEPPPAPAPAPKAETGQKMEEPETLEQAYKREFAFLDTQRRELQRLLQTLQHDNQRQKARLTNQIDRLQRQILDLTLEAKRLEEAILEAEKQQQSLQENASLLEMTLTQAKTSLKDAGLEVPALEGSDSDKLGKLFSLARGALDEGSRLHRHDGHFFLADGRAVQGTLIFLGNIAAYGLSDAGSGILIPAGNGHLKLIDQPGGAETAKALANGESPSLLRLFLFENLNKAVELEQEKTWKQILDDGGPIAWIIAALGVIGLVLALLRMAILTQAGWGGKSCLGKVVDAVAQGNLSAALATVEKASGAYPAVMRASLTHLHLPEDEWEIAVSDALLQQSVRLDRFGSLILVAAAVAPLLGLLGTVTGMIATFDVITRFGTGDPKLLATGIAVALITTQVGLIVAIPLLLLGNVLNGWAKSIKDNLEMAALELRETYKEHDSQSDSSGGDTAQNAAAARYAVSGA